MTENYTINIRGRLMDLSTPRVMGILNATPDSFYAGSRKQTEADIAERANRIISEGGDIIDVGAYSTRPGAAEVSEQEEMRRMREALTIVRREQPDAPLSIDTFRPAVMRMAAEEFGADIMNDVSGGAPSGSFGGCRGVPLWSPAPLQTGDHKGTPLQLYISSSRSAEFKRACSALANSELSTFNFQLSTYILMSSCPTIETILLDFAAKIPRLRAMGIKDIIIDPGFGFGKTLEQNYAILTNLGKLRILGLPILVGLSRKSMVYRLLGTTPDGALCGTTVANTIALTQGAAILRVHDVKECTEAIKIYKATYTA